MLGDYDEQVCLGLLYSHNDGSTPNYAAYGSRTLTRHLSVSSVIIQHKHMYLAAVVVVLDVMEGI